jgi:hypothetical protein
MDYVMEDIIVKGATRIYVQPGPFEFINGRMRQCLGVDRLERLNKLIKFYSEFKFKPATSVATSSLLKIIYRLLDIQEDPQLLMVRLIP